MEKTKKVGFYHKSAKSNKELIKLFENLQQQRLNDNWENIGFIKKLNQAEKQARKEVIRMLQSGEIKTGDDFYRAAMLFQHGENFQFYAMAVALAAISKHLGEPWGGNLYAMALDRFLLSLGQKQYFGTNLEKRRGIWVISPYHKKTSDTERRLYLVEPLAKIQEKIKEMNDQKD